MNYSFKPFNIKLPSDKYKKGETNKSEASASIHLKYKMYPSYNCILINELQKCLKLKVWKSCFCFFFFPQSKEPSRDAPQCSAPQCSAVGLLFRAEWTDCRVISTAHSRFTLQDPICHHKCYSSVSFFIFYDFKKYFQPPSKLGCSLYDEKAHLCTTLAWCSVFALLRGRAACPLNLQ